MNKALETPFEYAILLSDRIILLNPIARSSNSCWKATEKNLLSPFLFISSQIAGLMKQSKGPWGSHSHSDQDFYRTKWKRKFPLKYVPHGGAQWWCLTREAVDYILQFKSLNPGFFRYFQFVVAPDELIFQSILSNSRFAKQICGKITYDDWSVPSPPYPKILDEGDFDVLNNSSWLFARKFDLIKSARLRDLLDEVRLIECLVDLTIGLHVRFAAYDRTICRRLPRSF